MTHRERAWLARAGVAGARGTVRAPGSRATHTHTHPLCVGLTRALPPFWLGPRGHAAARRRIDSRPADRRRGPETAARTAHRGTHLESRPRRRQAAPKPSPPQVGKDGFSLFIPIPFPVRLCRGELRGLPACLRGPPVWLRSIGADGSPDGARTGQALPSPSRFRLAGRAPAGPLRCTLIRCAAALCLPTRALHGPTLSSSSCPHLFTFVLVFCFSFRSRRRRTSKGL